MTAENIKEIIETAEYDYFGVRADDKEYAIGEEMANSHQLFQDPVYLDGDMEELAYPYIKEGPYAGFYDAGELDGTCAVEVTESTIEEAMNSVKAYSGKHLYLVGGYYAECGNDDGEIIIREATVLAVL